MIFVVQEPFFRSQFVDVRRVHVFSPTDGYVPDDALFAKA